MNYDEWLAGPQPWDDPTSTFYRDGIRSERDWLLVGRIMRQCRWCVGWTEMAVGETRGCTFCDRTDYDPHSTTTLRSFNPLLAKTRKPKGQKKH